MDTHGPGRVHLEPTGGTLGVPGPQFEKHHTKIISKVELSYFKCLLKVEAMLYLCLQDFYCDH